jgi:hypothetical protein
MKKIERKSRVLQLHCEIVVHLSVERLRQAAGGTTNTACNSCHGSGTSFRTDDNDFNPQH